MQIYNYDDRGFYSHTSTLDDSDRDPLDTDHYLIPAGATQIAPPSVGNHQAARFDKHLNNWEIAPDFAGIAYYLDDAEYVMTERGVDLPAGAALEKPQAVLDQELSAAKTTAIVLIEQKASDYHALVVGTADKGREARFALNLECAKRLLAGEASAAERQMLQVQLEANQAAQHPVLLGKSLEQFARWIIDYEEKMLLGAAAIEATLIQRKAMVNAAQNIDELEQIKSQLSQKS